MDIRRLQAWWSHKQGLTNPNPSLSSAQVLEMAGWARSVGGASPYLTLFSRAGISREQADLDLANQDIHELPCARGCTYIVPKTEFALALKVGQGFSDEAAMNTARKFLGVTDQEIERLMDKVEDALAGGPLDARGLKTAVGDASRSLGDEGKKRGQTTTLPLALGFLQSQGRIHRIPVNGRIDQQRYLYARWSPSPLEEFTLSRDEAFVELAKRFYRWSGPATPAHFQWFTGLGVKAIKDALASLDLRELEDRLLIRAEDFEEFKEFKMPPEPIYSLVASIDSHLMQRRDLPNLLLPEDRDRKMVGERGITEMAGIQDLTNHAILDRGRVVGLWEYDTDSQTVAWYSFVPPNQAMREAIIQTEAFVRDQLADARSFSLDSPESRKPKIATLRRLAEGKR
ncbi:MAG: winged helix DNA-binding domain-containing protein [Chlorobia bacterium]|nr:winged helix DNA-binding domain-containing protein [Fimbriimonadaceae bacterium]